MNISASFARCLALRDKYLALSNQRLGDNPRDHDGQFKGFTPASVADVAGIKPDANPETCETSSPSPSASRETLPPWKIYPPPPPPHWHWKSNHDISAPAPEQGESSGVPGKTGSSLPSKDSVGTGSSASQPGTEGDGFKFEECEIPGLESPNGPQYDFSLNEEGVYQVYLVTNGSNDQVNGKHEPVQKPKAMLSVPTLKEYFTDLDFLLGVCSDGPAKSFAFRRLKYLASKWSLYCLLNEYQELADMKVSLQFDSIPCNYIDVHNLGCSPSVSCDCYPTQYGTDLGLRSDFYNVRKVDTHIHHSASMNQKHLLRFIKSKLKKAPNVCSHATVNRLGIIADLNYLGRRSSFIVMGKI